MERHTTLPNKKWANKFCRTRNTK